MKNHLSIDFPSSSLGCKKTRLWGILSFIYLAWFAIALADSSELIELEPYTVTGTLTATLLNDLPLTLSSVSVHELRQVGGISISEGLEYQPGMIIQNSSGRIKSPSIRGTRTNHTLILVDGRRMTPGFKSRVDLNQILQGGVDRVEVLRGPVSALYGSDAIGGVVNIITRRGTSTDLSGEASYLRGFGKWEANNGSFTAEIRSGKLGVLGSLSYRKNQSWDSGDGPPEDVDQVETLGGFANVDYHFSESQVLRTAIHYSDTERIGMRPTGGGALRTAKDQRTGISVEYEQDWYNGETGVVARIYMDRYENDTVFDLPPAKAAKFNLELESDIVVLDARAFHQLKTSLSVAIGIEYRDAGYDVLTDVAADDSVGNQAVFGQISWTPTESVDSVFGARIDDHEGFGSHLSPRVSVAWNFHESWRMHAGFGGGFRAPNVTELLLETFANAGKTTILPNANLEPETSESYEIGIRYDTDRFSFNTVYFHTEVEDMIEQVTIAQKGKNITKEWRNLKKVEIDGIETEVSFSIHPNLELKASFTWLDPVDKSTGYHVEGQYETITRIIAIGKIPSWGLQTNLVLNLEGSIWGAENEAAYDESFTVDIKFIKAINEQWSCNIGARNLLDEDHDTQLPTRYFAGINMTF